MMHGVLYWGVKNTLVSTNPTDPVSTPTLVFLSVNKKIKNYSSRPYEISSSAISIWKFVKIVMWARDEVHLSEVSGKCKYFFIDISNLHLWHNQFSCGRILLVHIIRSWNANRANRQQGRVPWWYCKPSAACLSRYPRLHSGPTVQKASHES